MPQLVAVALIGAGLYAGYRWVAQQIAHVKAEMERTEQEISRAAAREPRDLGALECDSAGVYRPARKA